MKKLIPLILVLVLALAACNGTTQSATNAEPTAVETVAQVQPTEKTEVAATATPSEPAADVAATEPAPVETPTPIAPGCYPEPISNLIDMTPNAKLAPVTAEEWQSGGDASAPITVIEYSDFQ